MSIFFPWHQVFLSNTNNYLTNRWDRLEWTRSRDNDWYFTHFRSQKLEYHY